jgi:hypothetical protein
LKSLIFLLNETEIACVPKAVLEAVLEAKMRQSEGKALTAELESLESWNRAFAELELPWRWDVATFRELMRVAGERDCVAAYVERAQPHLLRVYDKDFLRDLVRQARDRCRAEAAH